MCRLAACVLMLAWCVITQAAFNRVGTIKQSYHAKLGHADALQLEYRSIAHNWTASKLSNFALTLDFEFAALNQQSFDALMQRYSGRSKSGSEVAYKIGRNYTLVDFLPKSMQATFGLHFTAQFHNYSLPRFVSGKESKQVAQSCELVVNCCGFAYNALRAASIASNDITLSVGDPQRVWGVLTDSALSESLQSSVAEPSIMSNGTMRNRQLQPGDFVLVWHQNKGQPLFLDHIAIVIDVDLYYEKAGSGDNTPFRLVDWAGLVADWMPMVFHFEWRRPHSFAFPRPEDAFGLHNSAIVKQFPLLSKLKSSVAAQFCLSPDVAQDGKVLGNTYLWIKTLPLFQSQEGAQLDTAAFNASSLAIHVPAQIYNPSTTMTTDPACQDKMYGECGGGIVPNRTVVCCSGAHCAPTQKGNPPVCIPGE